MGWLLSNRSWTRLVDHLREDLRVGQAQLLRHVLLDILTPGVPVLVVIKKCIRLDEIGDHRVRKSCLLMPCSSM